MAKKAKKKQKTSILSMFIVIGLLIIFGYLGFRSYVEIQDIVEEVKQFSYQLPEEIPDKIDLPTIIGDKVKIEWSSSNTKVLSNDGIITQPSFEDDDVKVTLKGKLIFEFEEILSPTLYSMFSKDLEDYEYTFVIPARIATDEDKVMSVINRLQLVEETYSSINLPKKLCFESINIFWDSLNDDIMTSDGIVTTPEEDTVITLIAHVMSNGFSSEKEFKITVLANEPIIEIINDTFDDQAQTSKYSDVVSTSGVKYYNARIIEKDGETSDNNDLNATVPSFIRLRNKEDKNGKFEINNIINPKEFTFKYKFAGSQTTQNSKLIITITDGNIIYTEELKVMPEDKYYKCTLLLTQFKKVNIVVEYIDGWEGETFIDIDDVCVLTNATITDLEKWVINNTPTTISKSVILPFTTEFGGSIEWESNSKALTSTGIVTKQEKSQNVTLTATIKYLDQTSKVTIDVVVKGKGAVQELEIFFIDIGKYGAGDCGECTYIKYGDIDIIVDAGDHFDSTIQAITEAINQRMEDDVIEYVIATHPDGDHIGGMEALFENYEIETLIKFEGEYTSLKWENMEDAYIFEKCEVFEIQTDIIDKNLGDKFINLSNDVYISFLDTKYYESEESNGKSIVFTLNAYGTTVLMTGDADNASGHSDLESKYQNAVGNIDILKVVHHGTQNGTTIDFLNAVDPEVAIICNGNYLGNKHGHPTPTAIQNLYTYDSEMKVYAITGGGTIDGVVNKQNNTYKCSSEDRFNQRNGLITLIIDNSGYKLFSEYYGEDILELNDTYYYKAIVDNNLG